MPKTKALLGANHGNSCPHGSNSRWRWNVGRLVGEHRRFWAEGNYQRLPALAEELVGLNVDVLVTHGAAGALAAKNATSTVPIVITAVGDMVALGLVSSLSRPGGNITGSSLFVAEHTAKRLELIKEAVPFLTKVAVLLNPANASTQFVLSETEATAKASNVELRHSRLVNRATSRASSRRSLISRSARL